MSRKTSTTACPSMKQRTIRTIRRIRPTMPPMTILLLMASLRRRLYGDCIMVSTLY
jgi:hypothetical protein